MVRPLNFAPQSRLPFVQILSIYRDGREGLKLVSKMAEKKWSQFPFETFPPERQDYFFKSAPLLPKFFRWYDPKRNVANFRLIIANKPSERRRSDGEAAAE